MNTNVVKIPCITTVRCAYMRALTTDRCNVA